MVAGCGLLRVLRLRERSPGLFKVSAAAELRRSPEGSWRPGASTAFCFAAAFRAAFCFLAVLARPRALSNFSRRSEGRHKAPPCRIYRHQLLKEESFGVGYAGNFT